MLNICVKKQSFADGLRDTCFQPSIARLNGVDVLTFQAIYGGDFYGEVQYSAGNVESGEWSAPQVVEPFQWKSCGTADITEAIVDVRSIALPDNKRILAVGSSSFYTSRGCAFWDEKIDRRCLPKQRAFYSFFDPVENKWSQAGTIESCDCGEHGDLRIACAQMAVMADGKIVLPVYYATDEMIDYANVKWPRQAVKTLIAQVVGDKLEVVAWSNSLTIASERGFVEPSVKFFNGFWYMTIRSEDGRAYITTSPDALLWKEATPWRWCDGTLLDTDSTQQHFVVLNGVLYLCYTRQDPCNKCVPRFRTPIFIAPVDPVGLTLDRTGEQIVFPLEMRNNIPNMQGNFHCVDLSVNSAAVADCALYITPPTADKAAVYKTELKIAYIKSGE
ncbi:MAG: hypothetical protein E7047_10160 [Lentisphaerae bacterium]|nr:hypothetical protein [Lentisphaerota bacterium]